MLHLGNDRIALTLDPDFGARVVSLTDRATGRAWLVAGPNSAQVGEDAVYGADEAVGWDECFPTVAPCTHPAWAATLRDHGALWGRTWSVVQAAPDNVETRFEAADFRFHRRLTVTGAGVTAGYRVTGLSPAPLPYLWSQHCLLATQPADRIVLDGHENFRAGGQTFDWPDHSDRDLSRIGALEDGFALKVYSDTPRTASAAITGPGGGLRLEWDGVPAFGLWLCYGGWHAHRPVHQVALEPTTAGADDLTTAAALGQARWLNPDETHSWSVRMTLTAPDERTPE